MNNRITNSSVGYLYIFLCCVTNAVSFVFIAHLARHHNEMLSIALIFGYATILFTLFNYNKLNQLFKLVTNNKRVLLNLNISTLFTWFGSFLALKYLDPATALCIGLGLIAITNFLILTPINKFRENKHLLLCILFILLSMLLVIFQHANTLLHANMKNLYMGLAWITLAGISGGFIGVNSEKMVKVGFSATQVLATRFYLLTILGALLWVFTKHGVPVVIDWKYYFISSLIIVFFPLFMYHIAIKALGSILISFAEPITPVFAYFLQVIVGGYKFNLLTIILLSLACVSIVYLLRIEQKISINKNINGGNGSTEQLTN